MFPQKGLSSLEIWRRPAQATTGGKHDKTFKAATDATGGG
jgi:hypothetical protein